MHLLFQDSQFSHCTCGSVGEKGRRDIGAQTIPWVGADSFALGEAENGSHCLRPCNDTLRPRTHLPVLLHRLLYFWKGGNRVFCEGKGCICLIQRGPLEPFGPIKEAEEWGSWKESVLDLLRDVVPAAQGPPGVKLQRGSPLKFWMALLHLWEKSRNTFYSSFFLIPIWERTYNWPCKAIPLLSGLLLHQFEHYLVWPSPILPEKCWGRASPGLLSQRPGLHLSVTVLQWAQLVSLSALVPPLHVHIQEGQTARGPVCDGHLGLNGF